jgi:hypothetical protein
LGGNERGAREEQGRAGRDHVVEHGGRRDG